MDELIKKLSEIKTPFVSHSPEGMCGWAWVVPNFVSGYIVNENFESYQKLLNDYIVDNFGNTNFNDKFVQNQIDNLSQLRIDYIFDMSKELTESIRKCYDKEKNEKIDGILNLTTNSSTESNNITREIVEEKYNSFKKSRLDITNPRVIYRLCKLEKNEYKHTSNTSYRLTDYFTNDLICLKISEPSIDVIKNDENMTINVVVSCLGHYIHKSEYNISKENINENTWVEYDQIMNYETVIFCYILM